jgi:predicted permease
MIGVIVPRRLRADWRKEWEAELYHRETLLAEWDKLCLRTKLDLVWRSTSAFWDGLWIQSYRWEDEVIQDLRFGLRMLLKQPVFTLIAVLTLAMGVGANLTIFGFVDSFFFRPIPVPDLDRVVNVEARRETQWNGYYSYPAYVYFRDNSKSFESLAAHYSTAPLNVEIAGDGRVTNGAVVSANYFSLLGIKPALGRFFLSSEDEAADRDPVVVIGYRLWQDRLGGNPDVLGKEIRLNGSACRIVGVAPESFPGVLAGFPNQFWLPTAMLHLGYRWCDTLNDPDCRILELIGRLERGKTFAEAESELNGLATQLATLYPNEKNRVLSVRAPLGVRRNERETFAYQMQLLMAVTGLLLLVACANVASLLLVRAAARRKEIAIRLCIGVGRWRLIRQFLTENLILALAGGALGVLLSRWAKDFLAAFYNRDGSVHYDLSFSPRALAYAIGLTLFSGLLFGLFPAIQATRQNLAQTLKEEGGSQSARPQRFRSALVVGQVALSLALLVVAGLLVRSEAEVRRGANFDPQHVATLRLRPGLMNYKPEPAQAFMREVVRRFEATPGVESVTVGGGVGLVWLNAGSLRVRLPEQAADGPEAQLRVYYQEVGPRFCETLKIPIIEGREFNDRDLPGATPAVIINETLARRLWLQESAVARTVMLNDKPYQIVGVIKDAQLHSAVDDSSPFFYLPYWQNNLRPQIDARLLVRVAGDPGTMLSTLRGVVSSLDPQVPVEEAGPLMRQINEHYKSVLLTSSVVTWAGGLAFFLSMLGLYGVLAFSVSERRREIGIRMALGAGHNHVLKLVIGHGLWLTLGGVVIGLLASVAATQFVKSLLYGVSATDPMTFVVTVVLLLSVALLACWIPARRATRVDPLIALRHD